MTTTRDQLISVLCSHTGRDRGVGARTLAMHLDINERQLRLAISALREDGIAVCGTPSTGYYIAQTAEELDECCAFLRSRAMHSLVIESRLRQIPLPDLIGQLRLPT
ncbi:MAG: hypothetical protein RQ757_07090 [Pseudomonadales bacterium]|nr:hypothetical protein [Pseudomonadales bacterium]